LDEFIVMPNHVHKIVVIANRRGTACRAPTTEQFGRPVTGSMPTIIRSFKSAATKRIDELRNTPARRYGNAIITNILSVMKKKLNRIRKYIINNPLNWETDENYAGM